MGSKQGKRLKVRPKKKKKNWKSRMKLKGLLDLKGTVSFTRYFGTLWNSSNVGPSSRKGFYSLQYPLQLFRTRGYLRRVWRHKRGLPLSVRASRSTTKRSIRRLLGVVEARRVALRGYKPDSKVRKHGAGSSLVMPGKMNKKKKTKTQRRANLTKWKKSLQASKLRRRSTNSSGVKERGL